MSNDGLSIDALTRRRLARRDFLRLGGGALFLAVGAGAIAPWSGKVLAQGRATGPLSASPAPTVFRHLVGSDGWAHTRGLVTQGASQWFPDPYSPAYAIDSSLTVSNGGLYMFGFRDVTGLDGGPSVPTPGTTRNPLILGIKGHVQASAPLLYFDENDAIQLTLSNLGFQQRPDLTDSHTVHWHGFRNALPAFDGVPEMSTSVPPGSDFPFYYHPTDPGTYMYHCHVEDVEHVQMGMSGIVFVRPAQNKTGAGAGVPIARLAGNPAGPMGYVYNDGNGATAYDREFGIFLSEAWATSRYDDAHIQQADWSNYKADFFLMNGRTYPDTLAPNGGGTDLSTGDLIAPAGHPELQYQPHSSLVNCNAGDKVLLRFVNLGYTQPAMRLAGIKMKIVGKDATILRGVGATGTRSGADTTYATDTIHIGAGESFDAIFTAPPKSGTGYDTYMLYSTAMGGLTNPGVPGLGGQLTQVRVYAAGTLAPQTAPNA